MDFEDYKRVEGFLGGMLYICSDTYGHVCIWISYIYMNTHAHTHTHI